MDRLKAAQVAHELVQMLKPFLDRAQIAGSIRRKKDNVKDIEIVGIPRKHDVKNMFGDVVDEMSATEVADFIYALHGWDLDSVIKRNGKKYKRLFNPQLNICCDLFLTNPRRWGYQITIRTGPADFSRKVVTVALEKGWHFTDCLLHMHPKIHNEVCDKGEKCSLILEIGSEEALFEALNLSWIEPEGRSE